MRTFTYVDYQFHIKNTDEQAQEEIYRISSGRVPGTVPGELASTNQKLITPCSSFRELSSPADHPSHNFPEVSG